MTTAFISDLHLEPNQPVITELFLNFLKESADPHSPFSAQFGQVKKLYILGDLFEMWIGDDYKTPLNTDIISALNIFSTKAELFFLPGNRDFLIGQRFALKSGATLLSDPTLVDLYGRKTLLMHGDSLCTQDLAYQRFRRMVRHPLFHRCFLKLPLRLRIAIGRKMRNNSIKRNKKLGSTRSAIMDINFCELPEVMQNFKADDIIYGHTHRPIIEVIDKKDKYRYVLSDWNKSGNNKGNALICSSNRRHNMIYFDSNMNID